MATKPAFGIELRRAGRSAVRLFDAEGQFIYQGPTARVRVALPNVPMAEPMLVADSELRRGGATIEVEGWDYEAEHRAERAGLL